MLSTENVKLRWQYDAKELADPELIDKLLLSVCDSFGIRYPHFKLQLLISELVSNAIDHGVLALKSRLKDTSSGYESYLLERSKRMQVLSDGSVSLTAEWADDSVLRISVRDSGEGFNYSALGVVPGLVGDDACKPYGRGLGIISSLCKSVSHLGNGNCTVVEFDTADPDKLVS